jgi:hypothetical protein
MNISRKLSPAESIPGMHRGEGTKENDEGGEFKSDTL